MPRLDRPIEYTDHAWERLSRRNIDEADVIAALESPQSRHRHRPDGLWECWTRIPNMGRLLVVYEKLPEFTKVITVEWD